MKCGLIVTVLHAIACIQILNPRPTVTDAIISGIVLYPGEYPSLVFLASVYAENKFPMDSRVRGCGGTLIHPYWVLTAAHCFYDRTGNFIGPQDWVASFGNTKIGNTVQGLYIDITNFVKNNKKWLPVQTRISKIVLYPQYRMNDYHTHDIALLLLSEPVHANFKNINIMPLPVNPYEMVLPSNTKCGCGGWGCQFVGGDISVLASRGTFIIRPNEDCTGFVGNMTSMKICAGYADGTFSICQGDSGGPLYCYLGGKYVLAGVASYNSKADPRNQPSVFTRVASYLVWIRRTLQVY